MKVAGNPEDVIEEQLNVEELVEEVFTAPDYATPYAMMARKSLERARFLDENPMVAKVIKKVLIGCAIFCQEHRLKPDELDSTFKITGDGRIIIRLHRA